MKCRKPLTKETTVRFEKLFDGEFLSLVTFTILLMVPGPAKALSCLPPPAIVIVSCIASECSFEFTVETRSTGFNCERVPGGVSGTPPNHLDDVLSVLRKQKRPGENGYHDLEYVPEKIGSECTPEILASHGDAKTSRCLDSIALRRSIFGVNPRLEWQARILWNYVRWWAYAAGVVMASESALMMMRRGRARGYRLRKLSLVFIALLGWAEWTVIQLKGNWVRTAWPDVFAILCAFYLARFVFSLQRLKNAGSLRA